jgi:hypothetical protein
MPARLASVSGNFAKNSRSTASSQRAARSARMTPRVVRVKLAGVDGSM